MSQTLLNVVVSADTWDTWINKHNLIANVISLYAVTTDGVGGNTIPGGAITTGNAYINGVFSASTLAVNGVLRGGNVASNGLLVIDTGYQLASNNEHTNNASVAVNKVTLTSNSANQVIDTYSESTFRTAKYLCQVSTTSGYQTSEILLTHDSGNNTYLTEYAVLSTNGVLGTFESFCNTSLVSFTFNPTTSVNNYTINIHRTLLNV